MLKKIAGLALALLFFIPIITAQEIIPLPSPQTKGTLSVEEAIAKRRSEREYKTTELSNEQIAQLLWSAQGITDPNFGFRSAPSAGAIYPLQIYVAKKDGLFRYMPKEHKLFEISKEDKRPSLTRASLGQNCIREAPIDIIISANFKKTQDKFGPRAFRYVFMEVGHVAENIHLQAAALSLTSVPVGAFWDDVIKACLELPEEEDPLYIIPIGYLK